ncbi:MAG: sigma-70 family RNA polymerase sigma factor [Solirubrobacterales bacterium]
MERPALDSDAILISAAEPAGFATVFDRHFEAVHAYLQRRVGRDLADELAAQTFLVAFDKRQSYDPAQLDSRPWLYGIATNLLRRHHRDEVRQFRAYARSATDPVLDAFEDVDSRLDASMMRRRLVEVLAEIPSGELDALLLYAWADLSYSEIARALDLPTGTVRSRLSRARERLRIALAPPQTSTPDEAIPKEG